VDEAIELADRVAVLQDGRITEDVPVELEGPYGHGSSEYAALRASLLARLGVAAPGGWRSGGAATPVRTEEAEHAVGRKEVSVQVPVEVSV
jgi:sulfonate transport system ATP-binding protein